MPTIDYFFTLSSPFAYLGHRAFLAVARDHGAEVRFRPVALPVVFEKTGGVPLPQRPKARQDYRFLELQRWREKRGLALNLRPKHFPTNPALADRTAIAVVESGADPAGYIEAVFRALWAEERDIADRSVLSELLQGTGHSPGPLLDSAESERIAAIQKANTEDAIACGAIGSPSYVLNGEAFWGQDRIELLADALASGRQPYRAPES